MSYIRKRKSKRPSKYQWVTKDGETKLVSQLTEEELRLAVCDLIDLAEKVWCHKADLHDTLEKAGL